MWELILLPFRLLFSLIGAVLSIIGGVFSAVFSLVGGVFSVVFAIGSILVIPVLIYIIWKIFKKKK